VLAAFGKASQEVLEEYQAARMSPAAYGSFKSFRDGVLSWSKIADRGYMNARARPLGLIHASVRDYQSVRENLHADD
jgi:predicted Rdx family selenoprotein